MAKRRPQRASARSNRASDPLHILITAGPTREYIDAIRFISNPSSGRMGYAIATAAAARGHRVTLVSGPVALPAPQGVETLLVETGREMATAAGRAFRDADAAIFTAAVCDYRPVRRERHKLPKNPDGVTIEMTTTEDIAASLGRRKGRRVTLAFALEDRNGRQKAERKRIVKHADAILLNGPANLNADRATFEFLDAEGRWHAWPSGTKQRIAERIIRTVEKMCASR
ncbi:MAG TPA: phosphopantothenoylcysteine decarboxylase [Phycisphaerae bacterium]|nr:phosphopantothenoylcysteine decarboxylase [Phycisphaerae bacterium]HRW53208.1 phosphopantothenoylcysteine decarboxylase [Phycisphaerae bacterium]